MIEIFYLNHINVRIASGWDSVAVNGLTYRRKFRHHGGSYWEAL